MQSWQLIPILLVAGAFAAFSMRKQRGKIAQVHGDAVTALRSELAAGKRPDEGEPICVTATQRKLLSAKLYYLGLTNRRLVLTLAGGGSRSFDRAAVQLAIKPKTFADIGNMQTTYSQGWELRVALPDGEKHTWRVYAGTPEHAAQVHALAAALG